MTEMTEMTDNEMTEKNDVLINLSDVATKA